MIQLEAEKRLIYEFTTNCHHLDEQKMLSLLNTYYSSNANFKAPYPLPELNGIEQIYQSYYQPLLKSFPDLRKHLSHLLAGTCDNQDWVVASGYYVANFEADFLDIPCTNNAVWIRYAEYYQFKDQKIVASMLFVDLIDLMLQAGIRIVPTIGPEIHSLPPISNDGIILYDIAEIESKKTLKLIEDMCYYGLPALRKVEKAWQPHPQSIAVMAEYWHDDMLWYGPAGIGSSKGIAGFEKTHEIPWEMTFKLKDVPIITIGDGNYASCCGWPAIYGEHHNGCIFGIPATGKTVDVNLIDIWRRDGDKLIENWVFIDLLLIFKQLGLDVFDRLKNKRYLLKT